MFQKAIAEVIYPAVARWRGSREVALLQELRRTQSLPADQLHELRLNRLRTMLEHAGRYVPFYRQRFKEAGFNPERVADFSDLQKLPVLTKRDIQGHRQELLSEQFAIKDLVANRTGGSTGAPLQFYHEAQRWQERQAATLRHNEWAGFRIGDKVALIWGHQADLSGLRSLRARMRNAILDRQLILDSSSLTDARLEEFAARYRRFRPRAILAYANSLAEVVSYFQERDVQLPPPRTIITSAEVLTAERRALIEDYFGVRVFDRYGSRETSVIASECRAHDGLHICAEYLHLEFVEQGRPVAVGEAGEILVTVLGNLAFPWIRYQIGDLGSPAPEAECSCGVRLPKMQMVAGRVTDFLLAPDGRKVSGAALTIHLVATIPGVKQAQIVQEAVTRLDFNLVVNADFDHNARASIEEKVREYFGPTMTVTYNYRDEIPRESSGKYRFSICKIPPEQQR